MTIKTYRRHGLAPVMRRPCYDPVPAARMDPCRAAE